MYIYLFSSKYRDRAATATAGQCKSEFIQCTDSGVSSDSYCDACGIGDREGLEFFQEKGTN